MNRPEHPVPWSCFVVLLLLLVVAAAAARTRHFRTPTRGLVFVCRSGDFAVDFVVVGWLAMFEG